MLYRNIFNKTSLTEIERQVSALLNECDIDYEGILGALCSDEKYSSLVISFSEKIENKLLSDNDYKKLLLRVTQAKNEKAVLILLAKHKDAGYTPKDEWKILAYNLIHFSMIEAVTWLFENNYIEKYDRLKYLWAIPSAEIFHAIKQYCFDAAYIESLPAEFEKIKDGVLIEIFQENLPLFGQFASEIKMRVDLNICFVGNLLHYAIHLNKKEFVCYLLDNMPQLFKDFLDEGKRKLSPLYLCRTQEMANLLEEKGFLIVTRSDSVSYCQRAFNGHFSQMFEEYSDKVSDMSIDEQAISVYSTDISNAYQSILSYVELLFQKHQIEAEEIISRVTNLFAFNELIKLSAKNNHLSIIQNLCLPTVLEILSQTTLNAIFMSLNKQEHHETLNKLLSTKNLPESALIGFAIHCFSGFHHPYVDYLLIKFSLVLLANREVNNLIKKTNMPKMAVQFIKQGISYDEKKLLLLKITADIEGDVVSSEQLQKQLINIGKKSPILWRYNFIKPVSKTAVPAKATTVIERYGQGISQQSYHDYHRQVVSIITAHLLCGKFSLIDENASLHLSQLGDLRRWIAVMSNSPNQDFGLARDGDLFTPLIQDYYPFYLKFLEEMLPRYQTSSRLWDMKWIVKNNVIYFNTQLMGQLNGKEIALTSIELVDSQLAWVHCPNENIGAILGYVQQLIDSILQIPQTSDEFPVLLSRKLGEIHWWLAHATPFWRGSAAITGMIIKAIAQFHGFTLDWHSFIDCEALICPSVEDFAINYSKLCSEFTRLSKLPSGLKMDSPIHGGSSASFDEITQEGSLSSFTP